MDIKSKWHTNLAALPAITAIVVVSACGPEFAADVVAEKNSDALRGRRPTQQPVPTSQIQFDVETIRNGHESGADQILSVDVPAWLAADGVEQLQLTRSGSREPHLGGLIWRGQDEQGSDARLYVTDDDKVFGFLTSNDKNYWVSTADDGSTGVVEVHGGHESGCDVDDSVEADAFVDEGEANAASEFAQVTSVQVALTGTPIIDVLFVYTPQAADAADSEDELLALAVLNADDATKALNNSGVDVKVRAVAAVPLQDNQIASESFGPNLNSLTSKTDGVFDEAHELRDTYGADLVSIVLDSDPGATFGKGHILCLTKNNDDSKCAVSVGVAAETHAFQAVTLPALKVAGIFVHELGHNLGLSHGTKTNYALAIKKQLRSCFTAGLPQAVIDDYDTCVATSGEYFDCTQSVSTNPYADQKGQNCYDQVVQNNDPFTPTRAWKPGVGRGFFDETKSVGTIMTYQSVCPFLFSKSCSKVPRFSESGATYTGDTKNLDGTLEWSVDVDLGNGNHHSVGTLYETVGIVSGYRDDVVSGNKGARFGFAVAAGDFDGDGDDDLAVGSPRRDVDGVEHAGGVHIFAAEAGELLPDVLVTQSGVALVEQGDLFGFSAVSGDFNSDGYDDLVVGSPGEAPWPHAAGGQLYVYHGGPAGLTVVGARTGVAADLEPESVDNLGYALAVGDVDGDGVDDLVASAPDAVIDGVQSGAVLVFHGTAGEGLATDADLLTPLGFGAPFETVPGDVDGNGETELADLYALIDEFDNDEPSDPLAVGPPDVDDANLWSTPSKKVSPDLDCNGIVDGNDGLIMIALITGSPLNDWLDPDHDGFVENCESIEGTGFGFSLALGDRNGDGKDEVVVGAPKKRIMGNVATGAVYVFAGDGEPYDYHDPWRAMGINPYSHKRFGNSLATGNLDNDDDTDELVIGVRYGKRAHVIYDEEDIVETIFAPDDTASLTFGFSVAVADVVDEWGANKQDVVIGDPQAWALGIGNVWRKSGAIFVFQQSTVGLIHSEIGSVDRDKTTVNEDDSFGERLTFAKVGGQGATLSTVVGGPRANGTQTASTGSVWTVSQPTFLETYFYKTEPQVSQALTAF